MKLEGRERSRSRDPTGNQRKSQGGQAVQRV